jgi:hypothetical protein
MNIYGYMKFMVEIQSNAILTRVYKNKRTKSWQTKIALKDSEVKTIARNELLFLFRENIDN